MPAIEEFMTGLTDWPSPNSNHHTCQVKINVFFQKRIRVKIRLDI